jgi:hypothetical protein
VCNPSAGPAADRQKLIEWKMEDTSMHFVDIALHHLLTPNVEVGGIVAFFGPHSHSLNFVTNFGIGMRF